MTTYSPDIWVILKHVQGKRVDYRVLAGWSGGYTQGDEWRINSGIVKITDEGGHWKVVGESGNAYLLCKHSCRIGMSTMGILSRLKNKYGDNIKVIDIDDIPIDINGSVF